MPSTESTVILLTYHRVQLTYPFAPYKAFFLILHKVELKLRHFFVTENGQGFTRQHFVLPYAQSLLSYISSAIYITPTVFCVKLQLEELKPIYLSHTLKCWEDGSVTVTIDAS